MSHSAPSPTPIPAAMALPRLGDLPPLSRLLVGFGLMLSRWEQNHSSRKALARLEVDRLADIGLDETSRDLECARPFWKG